MRDIKLNTEGEISYLQAACGMYYYDTNNKAKAIFRRYSEDFTKISDDLRIIWENLLILSEGCTNISEHFPNFFEDCLRCSNMSAEDVMVDKGD